MQLNWDWNLVVGALPYLLKGLEITLLATTGGMLLALAGGLLLAILRRSRVRWVSWPTAGVIEFVRSTPLLIQLFFVYFLLPDFVWYGALPTGILVLGIHYSCYISEVYRSGIESVPRGQWDAAQALNLAPGHTWRRIILPQALPPIIPALGNYLVAMLKDTPLYAITIQELLSEANNFNARVGSYVESYTMVGLIFLLLSLTAAALIRWSERALRIRGI